MCSAINFVIKHKQTDIALIVHRRRHSLSPPARQIKESRKSKLRQTWRSESMNNKLIYNWSNHSSFPSDSHKRKISKGELKSNSARSIMVNEALKNDPGSLCVVFELTTTTQWPRFWPLNYNCPWFLLHSQSWRWRWLECLPTYQWLYKSPLERSSLRRPKWYQNVYRHLINCRAAPLSIARHSAKSP